MGGIPTLLCGDFRQCLPIIKNGSKANILEASLKNSYIFKNISI